MSEIIYGVSVFLAIQLLLTLLILYTKKQLLPGGDLTILINEKHTLRTEPGYKLLTALSAEGVYLPSACGGGGTCAQCRCIVKEGGGSLLATEEPVISRRDARAGYRLACQVTVKRDLKIQVPDEFLETKKWSCLVESNKHVATNIKELRLRLPKGEEIDFRAGGYIILEAPPHTLSYSDFDIEERFRPHWQKLNLFRYTSTVKQTVSRAYSMANYPGEEGIILLNVRLAAPPPGNPEVPPGQVSSYIFGLKPGDTVDITGPFGEFYINDPHGDDELIYIGAGAGMAPLRSHIFDLLKRLNSKRKISFWYSGRSMNDVFYIDEFEQLAKKFDNFKFQLSLTQPPPEANWDGHIGFVHLTLYHDYLRTHPAPEDIHYYICGPPNMLHSVLYMLDNLGVERENIHFDDFGG